MPEGRSVQRLHTKIKRLFRDTGKRKLYLLDISPESHDSDRTHLGQKNKLSGRWRWQEVLCIERNQWLGP